jgi:hypothetical protein
MMLRTCSSAASTILVIADCSCSVASPWVDISCARKREKNAGTTYELI